MAKGNIKDVLVNIGLKNQSIIIYSKHVKKETKISLKKKDKVFKGTS